MPVSSKDFLNIQATIECEFTLKQVRGMVRTYSQIHRTDKYSTQLNHLASLVKWLSVCLRSNFSFESFSQVTCSFYFFHLEEFPNFKVKSSFIFF